MQRKVILCRVCNGLGNIEIRGELDDYHHRTYLPNTYEICHFCGGRGSVVEEVNVTYRKLSDLTIEELYRIKGQ